MNSALVLPISVPISNGTAILDFQMEAFTACNNVVGNPSPLSPPCDAVADFLDPISITGATVYDANGNVVSGAVLTSQVGFNPNAAPTSSTPEPSSLFLLGGGLLAFLVVRNSGWAFNRTSSKGIFPALLSWLSLSCASLYADATYTVQFDTGNVFQVIQTGTSTVSATAGSLLPLPNSDTSLFLQAIAGPNDLGVYGNVSASGILGGATSNGFYTIVSAGAAASLQDSLFLTNAPAIGTLVLDIDITGYELSLAQNLSYPDAFIDLISSSNASTDSGSCVELDSTGSQSLIGCGNLSDGINVLTVPYVLTYNDVIPLQLQFTAVDSCETAYWQGAPSSCIASSGFLDTAHVASIAIEDSSGNLVAMQRQYLSPAWTIVCRTVACQNRRAFSYWAAACSF